FDDLGLSVIDEQHRFGVHQRLLLGAKGKTPVDMLVMTATPIPRSLMMSCYSDLDSSRLTEKPAGRKPIETRVLPVERLNHIISRLRVAMNSGSRVFWVCPLVDESEALDLAAATDRQKMLDSYFPGKTALLHGQMKPKEKDLAMKKFAEGQVDLMVSTTVIEVGVDVPEATIMVIEHAERFGLAQLHQLRGRVGRGEKTSSCLLLYASPLSQTARSRLEILRNTEDGFVI
ncbi:MAG: helicase-related protein, partial [Rhodospirillaceae bacterium]